MNPLATWPEEASCKLRFFGMSPCDKIGKASILSGCICVDLVLGSTHDERDLYS